MAVNVKQVIAAGFEILEYHILDSAGYAAGATGTVTAGSTGAPAGRIKAVKTMDIQIVEPEDVDITGDDGYQGGFVFGPAGGPSFTIEVAINNLTNDGIFQGTEVENLGDISLGVEQPFDPVYPDVALLAVSRARSKDAGSDGVKGYTGVIIPKCTIIPLGRAGYNERGEAVYRYKVKANTSDADPWGKTYRTSVQGTTGAVIRPWTAENRVTIHRHTGNSSATTFDLEQTPASSSIALKVIIFKDGLQVTSGPTVDTANKRITYSAMSSLTSKLVTFYEYTI